MQIVMKKTNELIPYKKKSLLQLFLPYKVMITFYGKKSYKRLFFLLLVNKWIIYQSISFPQFHKLFHILSNLIKSMLPAIV